jgi:uncharacterized protein (DUF2267 family)
MRAIRATVMAIGERLHDDERAQLARDLPDSLQEAHGRVAYAGDFDRDAFFALVARHEAVSRGFGVEHAEVVCAALGELLPTEAVERLRRELGPAIARLFEAREEPESLERSAPAAGGTVATGRPGSRHPISEGRYDNAHSQSVVRSNNPHGQTKLSSARGLTQERERETLATGHPGAARSLAEADKKS